MSDTRFPYTYASDYVRNLAGYKDGSTTLSRCEASQIRQGIAKAIGMKDEELAIILANYYQANEKELTEKSVNAFVKHLATN